MNRREEGVEWSLTVLTTLITVFAAKGQVDTDRVYHKPICASPCVSPSFSFYKKLT